MTTGVTCPGCNIHLASGPNRPCLTCQLQTTPDPFAAFWLRLQGGGAGF
jgi:hypothetical protein